MVHHHADHRPTKVKEIGMINETEAKIQDQINKANLRIMSVQKNWTDGDREATATRARDTMLALEELLIALGDNDDGPDWGPVDRALGIER
jgi:hypothetical protein